MSDFDFAFVETLGWMLVHSLWLLLIPTALLAVMLWLVPQRFSRVRYNAALGILVLMAGLPFGVLWWVDIPQAAIAAAEDAADVQAELSSEAEFGSRVRRRG